MVGRSDEVEARAAEVRVIRDPLYGDIRISDDIKSLIDTSTFQRLHRIKQLSTCDLVFPDCRKIGEITSRMDFRT